MVEDFQKFNLYASVLKTTDGKYKAVLSDDSIDREDEIVGKSFLADALNGKIFGLINHSNLVENRVCDWVNKKMEVIKGHNALTAEPQWFMSNPKAKMVKGILDDGAELGVSIGAMPTASDTVKIDNKEYKRYTEGKILEASFVGIPANENAGVVSTGFITSARNSNLLIAKSLKLNLTEEPNMPDENNEKDLAVTAKNIVDAMKETDKDVTQDVVEKVLLAAGIEEKDYKDLLTELQKPKQPPKKDPDKDGDDDSKDDKKSLTEEDINKLVEAKVTEKMKETPLYKQQMDVMDMTPEQEKDKAVEIQKSGKLPILTT